MTPICALGVENSEMKTQRTLCLEVLVGLAPHEEELGRNGYTVVNILRTRVLLNPDCRWRVALTTSCGLTPFAD